MFNLFRRRQYGGIVASLGLTDFWRTLSEDERQFIRECYGLALGRRGKEDEKYVDSPKIKPFRTTMTAAQFLQIYAGWAVSAKRYTLADRLVTESLRLSQTATDRHFALNTAIDLTYKLRNNDPTAIDRCIAYCREDIRLMPDFIREYKRSYPEYVTLPRIPSFQRLAIIYENMGRYDDAISVCELALRYGLDDGTKGGFKGRIERLQKH